MFLNLDPYCCRILIHDMENKVVIEKLSSLVIFKIWNESTIYNKSIHSKF